MKSRIYLAGPMGGLTYKEANHWRQFVSRSLYHASDGQIVSFSPMRGVERPKSSETALTNNDSCRPFVTPRTIIVRDYVDCQKADLIFVNFLGAKTLSIGTIMEIGFAYAHRIPIVAVIESDNVHANHPMMEEAFTYKVDNLTDGMEAALTFLIP